VRALNGARPPLDGEARAAVATLHGLYGCRIFLPLASVLPASVSQLPCPFYSAQVKRQMARICIDIDHFSRRILVFVPSQFYIWRIACTAAR
jgi:hypothetical protein